MQTIIWMFDFSTFMCRYPKLTKDFTEGLKLWPAYVCWARGHMRQATDFFMEAVSTLKDSQ